MDCVAEIETNRKALKRIIAVLFALADLADRAAGRSWPVRCVALLILHRAEEAAHAFVAGSASTANFKSSPPASAVPVPRRDGPIDAMRLALSFRTLALAVHAMLAKAQYCSCGRTGRDAGGAQESDRTRPLPAWPSPAAPGLTSIWWPDTS